MSKVKIYLEDGETLDSVESDLNKAFNYHVSGEAHEGESFDDPAVQQIYERMRDLHEKMYQELLVEISRELEKDYVK